MQVCRAHFGIGREDELKWWSLFESKVMDGQASSRPVMCLRPLKFVCLQTHCHIYLLNVFPTFIYLFIYFFKIFLNISMYPYHNFCILFFYLCQAARLARDKIWTTVMYPFHLDFLTR